MNNNKKNLENKMIVSSIKISKEERIRISNTKDLYIILLGVLKREGNINLEKEHFWFISFDKDNYVLCIDTVALGRENMVGINNIGTFRTAIWHNATYGIIAHNHTDGNLEPSEDDIDCTDRLMQLGLIAGIPIIDHLIITLETYMSFKDSNIMEELSNSLKYIPNFVIKERFEAERQNIIKEATKKGKKIGERKGIEKGVIVGAKLKVKEIAKKMKEKNIPISDIASFTNLSEEDIKTL